MVTNDIIIFFVFGQAMFVTLAFLKIMALERKVEGLTRFVEKYLSKGDKRCGK